MTPAFFFHTTQPRNFSDESKRLQLFNKATTIKALFAPDTIDTYSYLTDFSNYRIRSEFNADNIHVNNAGHQIIFERTLDAIQLNVEGDVVDLSVTGLPSFASIKSQSRGRIDLFFNPGFNDAGSYDITVTATDLQGNTDQQTFNLLVNDNQPKSGTQQLSRFDYNIHNGGSLDYYVYHPTDYDAYPKNRPVLISLHGLAERAGSTSRMLGSDGHGSHAWLANQGVDFPLMIVSPHQPAKVGGVSYYTWNIELVKKLIEHIKTKYEVDPSRIYLTGFSNGGQSAWQYAIEHPEDIAALIPLAGRTNLTGQIGINLQDPAYACTLTNIPMQVWHGSSDNIIPKSHSEDMVQALNSCNPSPEPPVEFNLVSGMNHDDLRPFSTRMSLVRTTFTHGCYKPKKAWIFLMI